MTIQNLLLGSTAPASEAATPQGAEGDAFATALNGAMEALADPPPDTGPPGLLLKTGNEEATPKLPNAVGPAPDLLPDTTSPMFAAVMPQVPTPEVAPDADPMLDAEGGEKELIGGAPFVGEMDKTEGDTDQELEADVLPQPTFGWPVLPTSQAAMPIEGPIVANLASSTTISPILDGRANAPVQAIATVTMLATSSDPNSVRDWSQATPPTTESAIAPMPKSLQVDAMRQAIGTQIVSPAVLDFLDPIAIEASATPIAMNSGPEFPSAIASIPAPRAVAAMPTISIEPEVFASVLETHAVVDEIPTPPTKPVAAPATIASAPVVASSTAELTPAPIQDAPAAAPASVTSAVEAGSSVATFEAPTETESPKAASIPAGLKAGSTDQSPVQLHSRTLGVTEDLPSELASEGEVQPVTSGAVSTEKTTDANASSSTVEPPAEARTANPTPSIESERFAPRPMGQVRVEEVRSVANQIADRIERLQEGRSPAMVTIHLDPKDLGSVTLTVRSLGRLIEADVTASNEAVRAALEQNRPHLAQAVESRGFTMGSLQFSQTQHQFAGGQSGQEQATRQDFERMANMARHQQSDDRSAPSLATWVVNDQSVDYRI